jgi:hypothetical protein
MSLHVHFLEVDCGLILQPKRKDAAEEKSRGSGELYIFSIFFLTYDIIC